ncbi:MAG: glycerol-3-phosphate dehydrogenase [Rhizobiaceae bacterium]|jgi:glycerol-3-phosphate dehydrogenase|nr:glycerol-3-phosphate dehydrogenase [Rhizobiaceae bacterium]
MPQQARGEGVVGDLHSPIDVFVIGGGINGCGIARDAVGRGYTVMLAEMNDLASGTSSWSTKLIHGGLRYLEHYEFRLVREALMEREVLWAMAPHIIWPLRFVLPHHKGIRPAWLIRLGLFLYDHIGGRKALPATRVLDLANDEAGLPIKPQFRKAFEYSDCWVNDARLVVLNAMDAQARGADIRTRTAVTRLEREGALWRVTTENRDTGARETHAARLVVNAAGPWVDKVLTGALARNDARNVRLVQGSHIVVKKKFAHERAYFFQNGDGRIFFAIPYEGDFTLIGTTDQDYAGDPADVSITDREIDYLIAGAGEYFREPIRRDDIVWTYSGVRPLYDDGASAAQEATRDYVLKADVGDGVAPLVNIFGGKITTYRRLAESMLEKIEALIGAKGPRWTAGATLPGGDFKATEFGALAARIERQHGIASSAARRLARLYGTRALDWASSGKGLGRDFGHGLTETEVAHLMDHEWAAAADDVLWRRTKLGLHFTAAEKQSLAAFMETRRLQPQRKAVGQ